MALTSNLQDRVVLVTGSSSGIGRATAVAFGEEKARVAVTYRSNREGAEETAGRVREAGGEAFVVQYDMTDRESIDAAVQAVADHWGTITVLVNNAAPMDVRLRPTPFEEIPPEKWQQMLRGIQDGVFYTTRTAIPVMRSADWGRIVTISSDAAENGPAGLGAYATAKAGLHGLTKVLAADLGEAGILSNVVMPGFVFTEKNAERQPEEIRQKITEQTPSKRLTTPENVADLVVFLGSETNGNINGAVIPVTGGR